jgi:type II secretory pathway component PulK
VILIICLWLLAAMSLLALGLAYRVRLEGKMVSYRIHREEMIELARGAVALVSARIEASDKAIATYRDGWAAPVRLSGEDLGGLGDEKLKRFKVEALVYDELGKMNINSAVREQMRSLGLDDPMASAIIDWRSEGDTASPMGAKSSYYQGLKPPYKCKSKPFDSIYELLVVRDVTPAVFFGADGDVVRLPDGSADWRPAAQGLRDLFTIYGSGKVNLNTAPKEVLLTVAGVTPQIADEIIHRRAGADGLERTGDDAPFKTFDDLLAVGGVTQFVQRQIQLNCVLASDTFDVRVEATDQSSSARTHVDAVLVRSDKGVDCVSWRER